MVTTGAEIRKQYPTQGEITTPSGHSYILRRPPLKAWGALGGLPAFFAVEIRKAWSEVTDSSGTGAARELSFEEKEQRGRCFMELLRYAFVSPRLVEENPKDDEITPDDLERAGDIGFLMKWIWAGSPDVATSSNPEGMQVSDLRQFPDGGQGGAALPPRENGADLRSEAVSIT